jgi:hypothetical protein
VIGAPSPAAAVLDGSARVSLTLPGGTPAGYYSIDAAYSGSFDYLPASGDGSTLTVYPFAAGPTAPWVSGDIGETVAAGRARLEPACAGVDILGAAGRIGADSDSFHFVRRSFAGDFRLSARIAAWTGGESDAQIGLLAECGPGPDAPKVAIVLEGGLLRFIQRSDDGSEPQSIAGPPYPLSPDEPDVWLRLERSGTEYIASYSDDGSAFTELARATPTGGECDVLVGIAATDAMSDGIRRFAHGRACSVELLSAGEPPVLFIRAEANQDGAVDISDATFILGYLFLGSEPPGCNDAADSDDSGEIDITDAVRILNYLFLGTATIPPPHPEPGVDPTGDELDCASV